MRWGLTYFPTDRSRDPREVAVIAEEQGFESLFFPEHTHVPAFRETPYPGGTMPEGEERLFDPFIALTAAATATRTLLLGTGVCLVVQRDPILCAKAVATADRLSGGRLLFGVGAGWNVEEMRNHGTDPGTRMRLLRERVEAMKELWTQDEASYHGRFVRFDRIWSWPKPLQRPHPPIHVGGDGARVLDRVLAYGDGWMPLATRDGDDRLLRRVEELRSRAAAAARRVEVTVHFAPVRPARLERYVEAGIDRCVFFTPAGTLRELHDRLERIRSAIRSVDGG
jgi:probable F420-dependent oxidoreductase